MQSHRFVGPVVLLKDFLGTILAAICKHHYHLIAVGPRGAGLLGNGEREKDKRGRRQVRRQARGEGRREKGKGGRREGSRGSMRSRERGCDTHPQSVFTIVLGFTPGGFFYLARFLSTSVRQL